MNPTVDHSATEEWIYSSREPLVSPRMFDTAGDPPGVGCQVASIYHLGKGARIEIHLSLPVIETITTASIVDATDYQITSANATVAERCEEIAAELLEHAKRLRRRLP